MTAPTTSDHLADPADLAARLGVAQTDERMLAALRSASARFRAAVRHPVALVTDDVITLDGNGAASLLLPAAPVTAVTRVLVQGEAVTDYQFSRSGMLRRPGGWPDALGAVQVTYTHGYDPVPAEVAHAVLDAAEAAFNSSDDIASMTVGGQQVTFRQGVSQTWATAVELYRLNRGDRW